MRALLLRNVAALLGLFALACGNEPPEPGPGTTVPKTRTAEVEEGPLVAFLGDSISAGLHLPKDDAFPAVLQRELSEDGRPFRLLNAGVSGDTTAGGVRRLDWILRQSPAVVVVELGGNDGLRGTPLESIYENLRRILVGIEESGAVPLLLGMRIPPNYGPEYASGYEAIYDDLAEELDVPYVPFFMEGVGGVARLNLPDGLHPTAEGHRKLAENLAPALREVLEGLPAGSF